MTGSFTVESVEHDSSIHGGLIVVLRHRFGHDNITCMPFLGSATTIHTTNTDLLDALTSGSQITITVEPAP